MWDISPLATSTQRRPRARAASVMARPRKRWSASESPESPIRTTVTESRLIVSSRKWSGTKVPWSMSAMDAGAPAEGMLRRCRRAATSSAKGRSVRGRHALVRLPEGGQRASFLRRVGDEEPVTVQRRVRRGDDDKVGSVGGHASGDLAVGGDGVGDGRLLAVPDGGHDERRMGNGVGSEQGHGITFLLEERVGSECRRGRGAGIRADPSRDSGFAFMMTHRIRIPHRTAKASRDCIRRLPTNRQQSGARR